MRDEIVRQGLERNWRGISLVAVRGDPEALWETERQEESIRSWSRIAVLEILGGGRGRVGFIAGGQMKVLSGPLLFPGQFGMRIGPADVMFFILPEQFDTSPPRLRLVEQTNFDDSKYVDLPVY